MDVLFCGEEHVCYSQLSSGLCLEDFAHDGVFPIHSGMFKLYTLSYRFKKMLQNDMVLPRTYGTKKHTHWFDSFFWCYRVFFQQSSSSCDDPSYKIFITYKFAVVMNGQSKHFFWRQRFAKVFAPHRLRTTDQEYKWHWGFCKIDGSEVYPLYDKYRWLKMHHIDIYDVDLSIHWPWVWWSLGLEWDLLRTTAFMFTLQS